MRKEIVQYQGYEFEIKTVSQANYVEDTDLIVVVKYKEKLLEFYHAHSEVVIDYRMQNKEALEDRLYGIAESEIQFKFIEWVKNCD